ncbi:hypothetical protein GOODEAATRI_034671 [Goodea atripinnis]|uniref:Uncharacterized protein n=1 Tax=Goodea atripinnis TaxID=208336 RepID=A0ABV0PJG8_9TELE
MRACYQLFRSLALPVRPSPVYTLDLGSYCNASCRKYRWNFFADQLVAFAFAASGVRVSMAELPDGVASHVTVTKDGLLYFVTHAIMYKNTDKALSTQLGQ